MSANLSHQSNRRRTAKIDAEKKIADFYNVNAPKRVTKKKEGAEGAKKRSPAKGKAKKGSAKKGKKDASPAPAAEEKKE